MVESRSERTSAKPGRLERAREHVLGAEMEEHRADIRGDPGIGDREDLGPAAVAPGAPHRRGGAAARPQQPAHLAERPHGIGDVHQPERADGGIEAGIGQRQRLGVAALEARVRELAQPCAAARRLDHLARDVGADDRAFGADRLRGTEADEPGAAGDVEHALARPQGRHVQHQGMRRLELVAPARLVRHDRAVPAVALDAPLQSGIHPQASLPLTRSARLSAIALPKMSRYGLWRSAMASSRSSS